MKKKWMALALAGVGLLIAGCTGCTPGKAYIEADRATFDAIAPEYLELIESSGKFDEAKIQRRKDTVESWRRRIDAAEGK